MRLWYILFILVGPFLLAVESCPSESKVPEPFNTVVSQTPMYHKHGRPFNKPVSIALIKIREAF
jgi:hypothetical protein